MKRDRTSFGGIGSCQMLSGLEQAVCAATPSFFFSFPLLFYYL